jgi:Smg protein
MFELLVYLFENYIEMQVRADEKTVAKELSAAGFDSADINQAFSWFSSLEVLSTSDVAANSVGCRIYAEEETKKIGHECLSFMMFLEQAGILNPQEREVVIDRLLALPEMEVNLEQTKWIALMVLWRHGKAKDYLFVEDALFNNSHPTIH